MLVEMSTSYLGMEDMSGEPIVTFFLPAVGRYSIII